MKLKNKAIIGAVHLQAMPGFSGFTTIDSVIQNVLVDVKTLQSNGVDAIIFENNYDLPHRIYVGPETVATMTHIIDQVSSCLKVPFGISVLWNDYRAALSICKACKGSFVRIPAFVDDVKTAYGVVKAVAPEALDYRKQILAEEIDIYTDIQVKHAQMMNSQKTIKQSAIEAKKSLSNGIIITGKWTGDRPSNTDLYRVRSLSLGLPIIIGSGVSYENLPSLLPLADIFIVSTSLKKPSGFSKANIYDQNSRFSAKKVRSLVNLRNQLLLQ